MLSCGEIEELDGRILRKLNKLGWDKRNERINVFIERRIKNIEKNH